MRVLKNNKLETKELVFEPGNATKYHLLLTQISHDTLVILDVSQAKTVLINPQFLTKRELYYAFGRSGYSTGEATILAEFLVKSIEEIYYIEYTVRRSDGELDRYTVWSKTRDESDKWMDHIGDSNGNITERGYIWQEF